jgi:hypothetical protein
VITAAMNEEVIIKLAAVGAAITRWITVTRAMGRARAVGAARPSCKDESGCPERPRGLRGLESRLRAASFPLEAPLLHPSIERTMHFGGLQHQRRARTAAHPLGRSDLDDTQDNYFHLYTKATPCLQLSHEPSS